MVLVFAAMSTAPTFGAVFLMASILKVPTFNSLVIVTLFCLYDFSNKLILHQINEKLDNLKD